MIVISIIIIIKNISFSITGNLIKDLSYTKFMFSNFMSIVFLIGGIVLLIEKRGLEYLVIPTGWEEQRIKRAREELDQGHTDKIVITGHVESGKVKGSHRQKIYNEMRKYGLKPSQMKVLDGIDSGEDILYLGELVKKGDTLDFDTFPLHFREYKTIINKAQKEGKFPKGVKLKNVKINQGLKETVYGILGYGEELVRKRPIDYVKNRSKDYLSGVKNILKRFLR